MRCHEKEALVCDLEGRKEAESTLPHTEVQTSAAMASRTVCFLGLWSTVRLQMEFRQQLPTIFLFLGRPPLPLALLLAFRKTLKKNLLDYS